MICVVCMWAQGLGTGRFKVLTWKLFTDARVGKAANSFGEVRRGTGWTGYCSREQLLWELHNNLYYEASTVNKREIMVNRCCCSKE
jgi:hypothetical protein